METKKNITIICSVRGTSFEYQQKLQSYVQNLEAQGHKVHYPARDTNQLDRTGIVICAQNFDAIRGADEVHVFFNAKSSGTHFDLGMAFALGKTIVIVENEVFNSEQKSFANMIDTWSKIPSLAERELQDIVGTSEPGALQIWNAAGDAVQWVNLAEQTKQYWLMIKSFNYEPIMGRMSKSKIAELEERSFLAAKEFDVKHEQKYAVE